MQNETIAFKHLLEFEDNFTFQSFYDISPAMKRTRLEGTWLEEKELSEFLQTVQCAKQIIQFFKNINRGSQYNALAVLVENLNVPYFVVEAIQAILNKEGKIKDKCLTWPAKHTHPAKTKEQRT
ncbi:MAG: hypothetical protein HC896_17375 [Bacteroidales bacterium]|nr:hypothetical protein [Bacteroidales bacterium]